MYYLFSHNLKRSEVSKPAVRLCIDRKAFSSFALFFFCILSFCNNGFASNASPTPTPADPTYLGFVPTPCIQMTQTCQGSGPTRTCTAPKPTNPNDPMYGYRSCAPTEAGQGVPANPGFHADFAQIVNRRINSQIKGYYRGCEKNVFPRGMSCEDFLKQEGSSAENDQCRDGSFVTPVCNLVPGVSVTEEITTNHTGQSCGPFCRLFVGAPDGDPTRHQNICANQFQNSACCECSGGSCRPRAGATQSQCAPLVPDGSIDLFLDHIDQAGTKLCEREESYLRGAFIAAINHHRAKLLKEVVTTGKLTLGAEASSCDQIARQVYDASQSYTSVYGEMGRQYSSIRAQLTNHLNIPEIYSCEVTWPDDNACDPGKLRQSSQYLCAARAGIEAAWEQLFVCVSMDRARKDYLGTFWNDLTGLKSEMNTFIRSKCSGVGSNAELQTCYEQWALDFLKRKINDKFPCDAECQAAAQGARSDTAFFPQWKSKKDFDRWLLHFKKGGRS